MRRIVALLVAVCSAWAAGFPAGQALAQRNSVSLIRDAEIENTIRAWSTPIFQAAGLDVGSVSIHLVHDRALNAFVAAGQRIFLHTGLLMRSESANQLIGVISHETGHIAGGHLAKLQERLRDATIQQIVETILTGAAIVGAGASQRSGVGGTPGGPASSITERMLFQYTQGEEQAADQAGISYLTRTGQSPRGMLEVLRILQQQERILIGPNANPYLRTHPLTQARIAFVEEQLRQSRFAAVVDPPHVAEAHRRMVAKLYGFIDPGAVVQRYPERDRSVAARYARAISYYRTRNLPLALAEIDALIREYPRDPYFLELKAQALFENGRAAEAVPHYERAVQLLPGRGSELLRTDLGKALIQAGRAREAIPHLEQATRADERSAEAWLQLATAYDKAGNPGMTALANAEYQMLIGERARAAASATTAERLLPPGSPAWQRASDIAFVARQQPRR